MSSSVGSVSLANLFLCPLEVGLGIPANGYIGGITLAPEALQIRERAATVFVRKASTDPRESALGKR
jgi:hypothetical protein